ncbi:hypothetical protein [Rhodoferax sp. PAMC 29310]|uniref:hypothetical protein n=1 Tax=Rhodoferax sp. PAMC 29310 TaxID=2822760 RepID=UPI001B33AD91|nr:hypothetical protein [Rhodoferax sp. PAMC 29310]
MAAALRATARKLGERRGRAAVSMLSSRLMEAIGAAKEDGYSYIWRSAIEDHEQDSHEQSHRSVLVDAVRDAALGATEKTSEDAVACVEALLDSKVPVLVRIGIYVCAENYGSVGQAFWKYVRPEWFVEVNYWHEVFWLIKRAFSRFSLFERQKFLEMVDQAKLTREHEEDREDWVQEHQRDLLHPAVGLGDAALDARYEVLVQRWGPVREHPDFHSYSTGGWVGERSPTTAETLVAASNEELEGLLKSFKPESRTWDGPTYLGFAATISAAVRASEDGFSVHLQLFVDQLPAYQHGLLRGLKERWADDKRDIAWEKTVGLIESIVGNPVFADELIKEPTEGWEPSARWVVSDIADLLKSGANRERLMPIALFRRCLEVLIQLLATLPSQRRVEVNDAVSHAINSSRGRALEAFIHVALAMRRQEVNHESKDESWARVVTVLEAELAGSASGDNPDFAALAGMYCVNFHYLNAAWTEANIDRIFSVSSESSWRCAVQGFSYQSYLHDWLYQRLMASGHLKKMIVSAGLPGQVSKRAVEIVGLAYLKGLETFENGGLLCSLVESLDQTALPHLSWFFWTLRPRGEEDANTHGPKVLEFWRRVEERIRLDGKESPELQSSLSLLAVFIKDLDSQHVEVWAAAAPHAQRNHQGYILLQEMARLVGQYPKEVARVFQAALTGFLPDYRREDAIRCVAGLAATGHVEEAENICNGYAERHSDLLKETYQAIRAQQKVVGR